MKKIKSNLYWIGVLAAYIAGLYLFGLIIALSLNLPDTMLGGMTSWALIIAGFVFAADDDEREMLKIFATKGNKANEETGKG